MFLKLDFIIQDKLSESYLDAEHKCCDILSKLQGRISNM